MLSGVDGCCARWVLCSRVRACGRAGGHAAGAFFAWQFACPAVPCPAVPYLQDAHAERLAEDVVRLLVEGVADVGRAEKQLERVLVVRLPCRAVPRGAARCASE